jgi:hypothetical protein
MLSAVLFVGAETILIIAILLTASWQIDHLERRRIEETLSDEDRLELDACRAIRDSAVQCGLTVSSNPAEAAHVTDETQMRI